MSPQVSQIMLFYEKIFNLPTILLSTSTLCITYLEKKNSFLVKVPGLPIDSVELCGSGCYANILSQNHRTSMT